MHRARLPYLLIPVAAFLATVPLLINGCSCGHDFDFHLLSWFEAARQFTHGNLHPHWAYTPAWNAGEPRFVFYPPVSWTIGAILGLIFPWTWTPILYTWLAITAAGLSLFYLARDFTTPAAATIAAVVYTVNPYMLFTAYERTAYAELLAAAWIPLLLHAILRERVTVPRIAIPVALLWLTNAPAAVMSCYALALLTLIRLINSLNPSMEVVISTGAARSIIASREVEKPASLPPENHSQTPIRMALNTIIGTALGLGLAAFYILPAAYERRFVQIAMAIIPFYRIQDNFLFHHTADLDHDKVLHIASLIAAMLLVFTFLTLAIAVGQEKKASSRPNPERASRVEGEVERPPHFSNSSPTTSSATPLLASIAILTITIALLQTPLTQFIWSHAPELAFLQFPWRLLAILAAVLALAIAIALTPLKIKQPTTSVLALIIAAALTYPAYTAFHQTCDPEDTVKARLTLFRSNQGTDPTDEYTPTTADNDSLAQSNPPYWLAPDPNAKAPSNTQPGPAPTHLTITTPIAANLILNLRDYPAWQITRNDLPITTGIHRADGLIEINIPVGQSTIDIHYAQTTDQTRGNVLSLISLVLLALLIFLSRQKKIA